MGVVKQRGVGDALPLALNLIREFEGCRLSAYVDTVGVVTIGWGETENVKIGDRWTQDRADLTLKRRVLSLMSDILEVCPALEERPECLAAVTSFTYNVGFSNYRKSSMCRKIKEGDWMGAADEFPRWNRAGGRVLRGLTRRRAAERELFLRGF